MSDLFKDVKAFESRLGLPNGFYEHLLKEDDWSFVIKASALFEAASTHLLSIKFRAPAIESELAFLEQANPRNGKIVLLKKMEAIYPDQAYFLTKLANLRNHIAHNIVNVNFSFQTYIDGFDKQQKKAFVAWAGHGIADNVEIKGHKVSRSDLVLSNPKISIWLTAAEVLACMNLDIQDTELKIKIEAWGMYKSIISNLNNENQT